MRGTLSSMKTAVFFTAAMILALSAAEAANASEIIDRKRAGRQARRRRKRSRAHQLPGSWDAPCTCSRGVRSTHGNRRAGKRQVRFPQGLLGATVDVVQEPVPCVRRAEASRSRSQHAPRPDGLVLGTAVLAENAPEPRRTARNVGWEAGSYNLSHWSGPIATLGSVDRLGLRRPLPTTSSGGSTYAGKPVYGFSASRAGSPLDGYGRKHLRRHVRLALREGLAAARKRVSSLTVRRGSSVTASTDSAHAARVNGAMYRLTAPGPGVTPDVSITVPGFARLQPRELDGRCVRATAERLAGLRRRSRQEVPRSLIEQLQ